MEHSFIYLASQSPRRKQLLDQIHVPYRLLLPQSNENAELLEVENKGELPHAYVQRVTNLKWQAAQQNAKSSTAAGKGSKLSRGTE
jgi:septum formation protein